MFGGIGAALAVGAAVYWFTSYEHAGTAMLTLGAGLAWFCGVYLWRHQGEASAPAATDADVAWFPHASIWPFWIGVAAFLLANGLILGVWFLVPGAMLLALGVTGFAIESRNRS
jgi:hypothetical protein